MREILFRGKQVGDGEWIEGYVFPQVIDGGYAPLCITTEPICANDYSEILGDWAIVDSSTVGQYTGLTDKNGKKIFEGDIIHLEYSQVFFGGVYFGEYTAAVSYKEGCFITDGTNNGDEIETPLSGFDNNEVEIIGNIHDNPELLGGESDG